MPAIGNSDWMRRPNVSGASFPESFKQKMLKSRDWSRELKTLRSSSNKRIRTLASDWSKTLDPSVVYELLNSRDRKIRQDAFEWLLEQETSPATIRQTWGFLARKSSKPMAVRKVFKWNRLAQTDTAIEPSDARDMCIMLKNEELIFRHAAFHFLSMLFENPFYYSPESSERIRNTRADKWTAMIQLHFTKARARQAQAKARQKNQNNANRGAQKNRNVQPNRDTQKKKQR